MEWTYKVRKFWTMSAMESQKAVGGQRKDVNEI